MKLNLVGLQVPEHRCEQEPIRFTQSCERTSRGLFEFFYLLEIVLVVAHRVVDRVGVGERQMLASKVRNIN